MKHQTMKLTILFSLALSAYSQTVINGVSNQSGNGITALTGDVTASGSGSVAATVSKINGTTFPASANFLASNGSSQPIAVQPFVTNSLTSFALFSGTYTSGITATGTVGQTCALTAFNGAGSSATATVALTGTNTIAGGTALVVTAGGSGYTSAPTSSTAGNGTATCSGTAVVATVIDYQTVASDFATCKTLTVPALTVTIVLVASGSQPATGQCVDIINYGTGVVTVARSGQNINGAAANLTIAAGSASAPLGLHVVSDGTNYVAQTWGGGAGGGMSIGGAITSATVGSVLFADGSGNLGQDNTGLNYVHPAANQNRLTIQAGTSETLGNPQLRLNNSAGGGGFGFTYDPGRGVFELALGNGSVSDVVDSASPIYLLDSGNKSAGNILAMDNAVGLAWSNSATNANTTKNTGLHQVAAGVVGADNGTNCSTAANCREFGARSYVGQGTVPGISGCTAGTQTGGNTIGKYSSGTTGTCTVVLTFAFTAANGWSCRANDITTPADVQNQTATTTTTATISGTTVTADVVNFACFAY
jgi:hypothetical protein